jgi:hypothetical protein
MFKTAKSALRICHSKFQTGPISALRPKNLRRFNFARPFTTESDQKELAKLMKEELKKKEERMIIGFTCNVCQHRQFKSMSKKAYQTGVVIIKCDNCPSRHLIADHLGWFDSQKKAGTIEDILREKGQDVEKLEYLPKDG